MSLHVCKKQSCILKKYYLQYSGTTYNNSIKCKIIEGYFLLILSTNYWVNLCFLNIRQNPKIHMFLENRIRVVECYQAKLNLATIFFLHFSIENGQNRFLNRKQFYTRNFYRSVFVRGRICTINTEEMLGQILFFNP